MEEFSRIQRLPAYVFNITGEMKIAARRRGEDIIDFGMGNPDGATPKHIVDKLVEAARKPPTHRYSVSRGLPRLRKAICNWYKTRYDVDLDPDSEAIVTIGSKEGIAHLCLAILDSHDTVLVPNPSYPIHIYGPVIAGAHIVSVPVHDQESFLQQLEETHPAHDAAAQGAHRQLPLEPDHGMRGAALPRAPGRAGPRVRLLSHPGPRLRRHRLRRLQAAQRAAGSRRKRRGRRVLHALEELQHARLAHRLHGRQPEARRRARAPQELLRLRHLHAHPGRGDRRARRPAGVRRARSARTTAAAATCWSKG